LRGRCDSPNLGKGTQNGIACAGRFAREQQGKATRQADSRERIIASVCAQAFNQLMQIEMCN